MWGICKGIIPFYLDILWIHRVAGATQSDGWGKIIIIIIIIIIITSCAPQCVIKADIFS